MNYKGRYARIIGADQHSLAFTQLAPCLIYKTDLQLQLQSRLAIPFDTLKGLVSNFSLETDSGGIFVKAGNIPALLHFSYEGRLISNKKLQTRFSRGVMISESSIVIRAFDTGNKNQEFQKLNLYNSTFQHERNISEKFDDGGFATDGLLYYDRFSGHIFYVYLYSNEFLCLDTSLNLIYRAHTIDTNRTRPFPVARDFKHQSFSAAIPLHVINNASCIYRGFIYICSGLIADNETNSDFSRNAVIDVYESANGDYLRSFYIPKPRGTKIKSFAVLDNFIVAVFTNKIITYKPPM